MIVTESRSKESIEIEKWLNSHVLELSHKHEIESLLIELTFLLDITPSQYKIEFTKEHRYLSAWLTKQHFNSDLIDLKKSLVYANGIQDKSFLQEIGERYVIAFLASRTSCPKINIYRSVYFLLCLRMVRLTDYDSRIKATLNECRYLTSKIRNFLEPFLPEISQIGGLDELQQVLEQVQNNDNYNRWKEIHPESLKDLIKKSNTIDSVENELTQQSHVNKKLADYIYEFVLPIENYFKSESGITRNTRQAEKLVDVSEYVDETTGNLVTDLVLVTEIANEDSAFEVEERQDDEEQAFEQVLIAHPTSYYLDKVRAEQQVNCRHQRSLSQATDVNNAHPDDIKILVNNLLTSLLKLNLAKLKDFHEMNDISIKYNLDHQASLYLLMLLLTGIPEVFIFENLKLSYQSYQYRLEFAPIRSKINNDWNVELCADNRDSLQLFFPEIIGKLHYCIANDMSSENFEQILQRANDQLKIINKQNKTRLTINKIKNYLPYFLIQEGRDIALIEVLTSKPINHQSSLPYFNVSQHDLFRCQSDFIEHLSNMLDEHNLLSDYAHQFFKLLEEKATAYWDKQMGSVLAIKEAGLEYVVSKIQNELQESIESRSLRSPKSIVELHNTFIDYLYIMLSVSSGYRPVREPFGRLSHIDTRTKTFFISDKENHQDTRGRLVYLPDIANEQIKIYVQYLQKNAGILTRLDNPLGDIYSKILESNIGLITYLDFDNDTDAINEVKLTKSYIYERLSTYINLPLNWHRHFIRSLKDIEDGLYSTNKTSLNKGFGYDLIGAWMGHADSLGFDFYNKYSGLKRKEIKRFASYLNDVLENIGFKVIKLEEKI
ncbi:hypothetical protein [Psychrobacter sp. SZ93C1]|uniref:hypothetical protein n=1 Tax=Psychrobacter sp. SZ93C1 TaxID=2792058 RepID=UPI0018CD1B93|nr:hypothetical protein [Psychrobacter sp. SZ93C1]MBH0064248.1 hypothetical protein [Psychrobacter sp. SZ93C1]